MATVPRQPLIAPRPPSVWQPAPQVPNLLFYGLAAFSAIPFNNLQAGLPVAPPRMQQSWTQSLLLSTLRPKPFVNNNNFVPQTAPQPVRSWTSFSRLLGQDQFYRAAGQGPQNYDWPLPKVAQPIQQSWTQNLLQSTLSIVLPPFIQQDWKLPVSPPRMYQSWISSPSLLGQDQFFGAPGQGPINADWPLPKAPVPIQQGWTQNLLLTTLAVTQPPFVQTDWPLPKSAAIPLQTWTQNLLLSTLSPVQPPFAYSDWRLPVAPPRLPQSWTSSPSLLGQDQFFGAPGQGPINADWPLPKTYTRSEQTWTQSLLLTTLSVVGPMPFQNYDWPLPKVAPLLKQKADWSVNLNLLGQDQMFRGPGQPLQMYDWPLPVPNPRMQQNWSTNLLQTTLTPPPVVGTTVEVVNLGLSFFRLGGTNN